MGVGVSEDTGDEVLVGVIVEVIVGVGVADGRIKN